MPLKPIASDRLAKPVGPFSPAVRDGDRVYTSGQVAQDPATGKLIEGSVATQTEQIFHNLQVILEAADKSLADVVKVNVYLMDIARFGERTALIMGLLFGMAAFSLWAFAPSAVFFWLGIPLMSLWGIANAALMGLMSRRVGPSGGCPRIVPRPICLAARRPDEVRHNTIRRHDI